MTPGIVSISCLWKCWCFFTPIGVVPNDAFIHTDPCFVITALFPQPHSPKHCLFRARWTSSTGYEGTSGRPRKSVAAGGWGYVPVAWCTGRPPVNSERSQPDDVHFSQDPCYPLPSPILHPIALPFSNPNGPKGFRSNNKTSSTELVCHLYPLSFLSHPLPPTSLRACDECR